MPNSRGFTLIETLVIMGIFSVLLVSSIPSFSGAIDRYQVRSEADRLQSMIKLARVEAVQNLQRSRICPSEDLETCDDSADADWSEGFIVALDVDDNGTYSEVVQVVQSMGDGSEIVATDTLRNPINSLTFRSIGVLDGIPGAVFQLRLPECEGLVNRNILVGFNGISDVSTLECEQEQEQ